MPKSANELKEDILKTTVPVSSDDDQDFESPSYEVGPVEEPEAPVSPTLDDQVEQAEEKRQDNLNYLPRQVEAAGGEEQFRQNFQNAQFQDFQAVKDLFRNRPDLADAYASEYIKGQIKISPEMMQNSDVPQLDSAIDWVGTDRVKKRYNVSSKDIDDISVTAREEYPRSASKALLFPPLMHPEPRKEKPKPKRKEPTYQMPNISDEDFKEMLGDWSKKHPERWRR